MIITMVFMHEPEFFLRCENEREREKREGEEKRKVADMQPFGSGSDLADTIDTA